MKKMLVCLMILSLISCMVVLAPVSVSAAITATPTTYRDGQAEAGTKFNAPDGGSARSMTMDTVFGTHFSINGDATYVGVGCPSWSDNVGCLTVTLYNFDTDYEKSVSGTPIATSEFVDYPDNSMLGFEFDAASPLPKGEYVMTLTDAYDDGGSGVGVWAHQEYAGQMVYENGEYNEFLSLRMSVRFAAEVEVPYSTLTSNIAPVTGGSGDMMPELNSMIRFSDPYAEDYISGTHALIEAEIVDGIAQLLVSPGDDMQFYITMPSSDQYSSCEDYPFMLLRIKIPEGAPRSGEVFFSTTENSGIVGGQSATVSYGATTDWQNVIVKFKSNNKYKGELMQMRYDVFERCSDEYLVEIEYMLFFASMDAANAWTNDFSVIPTPAPTPVPTPSPVPPTKAPVTKAPEATKAVEATKAPDKIAEKTEEDSNNMVIIIVIAAVVVVAGVVAAIVIIKKKKG